MKKSLMSLMAAAVLGGSVYGGGDIVPEIPLDNGCRDGFYVGAAVADQRTYAGDSDWFDRNVLGQDHTYPLIGIAGYRFNCYLAVEGRISQSIGDEDYADVLTYSIFLKPMYPVTEEFTVYALLGYGVVRVEGADGDTPAANVGKTIVDKGSFQWGFGASYDINENWTIFADYTRLMDEQSIDPQPLYYYDAGVRTWDHISDDSINVGVMYRF